MKIIKKSVGSKWHLNTDLICSQYIHDEIRQQAEKKIKYTNQTLNQEKYFIVTQILYVHEITFLMAFQKTNFPTNILILNYTSECSCFGTSLFTKVMGILT
uniref:Uncharacterized protein n=1 Tax=Sphaerodactylus townsendi TaxID=933632 RepID=A0ACB8F402_9SAUR